MQTEIFYDHVTGAPQLVCCGEAPDSHRCQCGQTKKLIANAKHRGITRMPKDGVRHLATPRPTAPPASRKSAPPAPNMRERIITASGGTHRETIEEKMQRHADAAYEQRQLARATERRDDVPPAPSVAAHVRAMRQGANYTEAMLTAHAEAGR